MPFKSRAQRGYLYVHHPELAKKWAHEYPNQDIKALPKHVKKAKGKRRSRSK